MCSHCMKYFSVCGGQKIRPQGNPLFNVWTLWLWYLTRQKDFKVVNLRWGDHTGLLSWARYNQETLKAEELSLVLSESSQDEKNVGHVHDHRERWAQADSDKEMQAQSTTSWTMFFPFLLNTQVRKQIPPPPRTWRKEDSDPWISQWDRTGLLTYRTVR